jgi:hypothetical protein
MSRWRKEASDRLPELQRIIASRDVDGPMMLWIELCGQFRNLCEQDPLPVDLLRRIWGYALWCMTQDNGDLANAAAVAFAEHLIDSPETQKALPQIMPLSDYDAMHSLLLYHNNEEAFQQARSLFMSEDAIKLAARWRRERR